MIDGSIILQVAGGIVVAVLLLEALRERRAKPRGATARRVRR